MKRIIAITMGILFVSTLAYAASDSITTSTSATILPIFSIEFYADNPLAVPPVDAIRYDNGQIDFPAIDPALEQSMVMTSAWGDNDGKSDVGVVCRTNIGQNWALKVKLSESDPVFEPTNIAIYKPKNVYNRNIFPGDNSVSTGLTEQWYIMSPVDETIFTGTGTLQNSAPFGILATFSFAILPTGKAIPSGQAAIGTGNVLSQGTYNLDIVYTLTTTL